MGKKLLRFANQNEVLSSPKNGNYLGQQQCETSIDIDQAQMLPLLKVRPLTCALQCGYETLLEAARNRGAATTLGIEIDPTAKAEGCTKGDLSESCRSSGEFAAFCLGNDAAAEVGAGDEIALAHAEAFAMGDDEVAGFGHGGRKGVSLGGICIEMVPVNRHWLS